MAGRDPGLTDDGIPRDVDRVEFERLESGAVRWIHWSGAIRVHSETIDVDDWPGILRTTELLMAGGKTFGIPK